ncbi:MAG: putative spermidine/putrescine transport system permease protein, partial [Paraburkholderia sp.]|nr:putative spermidine/putrescine transport system permease protein [Paraburkholderia sp.]
MNTPTLSPPRGPFAPRDAKAWLVTPALIFIVALFIYPFAYGLVL